MEIFTSWRGLWSTKQRDTRKSLDDEETDDETAIDSNDSNDANCNNNDNDATAESESRPVAVFSILPPDIYRGGHCGIDEEWLESNEKQPRKLQDDPVALCVAGRFLFYVSELCREHPATSSRTRAVFWAVVIAFLMLQFLLLVWFIRVWVVIYILVWIVFVYLFEGLVEGADRSSPEFSERQRIFRDAIRRAEAGFASMLGECGYRHELHQANNGTSAGRWKLFLYTLEGAEQRLPAASELPSLQEDEEFKKAYDLWPGDGVIEHRNPPHNEDRKEEDTSNDVSKNASNKDTLGALDIWTFWGLFMGERMNHGMAFTPCTTWWFITIVRLLFLIPFVGLVHSLDYFVLGLAGMVLGLLLVAAVAQVVERVFELPQYETANARMANALDPLVRERHGGYGLSFRPATRRFWSMGINTAFVLEPPATTLVEVPVVV